MMYVDSLRLTGDELPLVWQHPGPSWTICSPPTTATKRLFVEQVRVRAGSGKLQLAAFDAVEQKPVRFDVQIAKPLPIPLQRVIVVGRRQRLPGAQS